MADTQPLSPTDAELTAIYKAANGEDTGKAQPLTTQHIFRAMRAAIAKWGAQPVVPAGYALVPVDPTYVNIQQRCAEVMEWRRTGILCGNALREYSEEHWAGHTHDLQLAEQETAAQAMTVIAKLVAQPVEREPLTRQQLREAFHKDTGCTLGGDIDLAERVCGVVERAHGITTNGRKDAP